MGMFDQVYIDIPDFPIKEFQTKDLDCLLDSYVITKDKELTYLSGALVEYPEGELFTGVLEGIERIGGCSYHVKFLIKESKVIDYVIKKESF